MTVAPPHQLMTDCACVGAWGTAVLRGAAAPDRALDAMRAMGFQAGFSVDDHAGDAVSFALAVGSWRSRGITGWRYVPVAPGDSQGVPGPQELRARALDSGAVLLSVDGPTVALVPHVMATTVVSSAPRRALSFVEVAAAGRGVPAPESLAELDRDLLHALTEVTERLAELEVASWRDDVAGLMREWDRAPDLPPMTSARAQRLAARSGRVLSLVELATDDHGGSRTAMEMSVRAEHLRTLARVARAAHAAAWNAAGGATDVRG